MGRLEARCNKLFVRNAPRLSKTARKTIVAWMPIVSLFAGVLALLTAMGLWRWARIPDKFAGVCNAHSVSGCGNQTVSRFSTWLWIALISIVIEGVLYLLAYSKLWNNKRKGWKYMYRGMLLNLMYAIASLFTGPGRMLHFMSSLIVSILGLYVLFQVRRSYGVRRVLAPEPVPEASQQPGATV